MTGTSAPSGHGPGGTSAAPSPPRLSATARAFATVIDHPWLCLIFTLGLSALAAAGYRDTGFAEGAWKGTWWQAKGEADAPKERANAAGGPAAAPRAEISRGRPRRAGRGRGSALGRRR